jgi:hypothetical protein
MLKHNCVLSSKIKISSEPDQVALSGRHVWFYTKYSYFTLKALNKGSFQKFLVWMLTLEEINETNVNSVDIEVFPIQGEKGHSIAGKCDTYRGRIRIYPKPVKFCKTFSTKFGRSILFTYAGNRARAALIHELLHLKYADNEAKVRELTKQYYYTYTKKQFANKPVAISMCSLIFDSKNSKVTS